MRFDGDMIINEREKKQCLVVYAVVVIVTNEDKDDSWLCEIVFIMWITNKKSMAIFLRISL